MLASAWLLFTHYDRFWYPPDEGNYAHVAQRVLHGEVLNRDVQDVHPGYINFLNAAALGVFGIDLVSLRYPIVLAGLVQAAALLVLFPREAPWRAATAAIAATALGAIQFMNPTAHWPCLALTFVLVAMLSRMDMTAPHFITVGVLLGTIALFRQLTGFVAGVGVVTFLLTRLPDRRYSGTDAICGRAIVALMFAALAAYLVKATDISGIVLFGAWPLSVLARVLVQQQASNSVVLRSMTWLAIGVVVSASPLAIYHAVNGSSRAWVSDVGPAAIALTQMDFFERTNFGALVVQSLLQVAAARDVASVLNGCYWVALTLLAAVNGTLVYRALARSSLGAAAPLPIVAVFYAVVSVHFQIPLYLYYSAGLTLSSLLWMSPEISSAFGRIVVAVSLALSAIGIYFHAGQPASRTMQEVLRGVRGPAVTASQLPHCALRIDESGAAAYRRIVDLIQRRVPEQGSIFAVPSNAELYFLTQRRNPFRFYNTALGVRSDADLAAVERTLAEDPPALVTFNAADKYNTARSTQIMDAVRKRYVFLGRYDPFDVYVLP
jgi:hypothetical protein